jgi:hypothetical protein
LEVSSYSDQILELIWNLFEFSSDEAVQYIRYGGLLEVFGRAFFREDLPLPSHLVTINEMLIVREFICLLDPFL